jgi:hypothetical protein
MYVLECATGENKPVIITPVSSSDFKNITIKRHSFNWKERKAEAVLFKLTVVDSEDILGLIALLYFGDEERVEIKLLSVATSHIGRHKIYDRIAGCLIAFAGMEAIRCYLNYPCISLVPKTELKHHYIKKYGMEDAGWQLYLDGEALLKLINEYL